MKHVLLAGMDRPENQFLRFFSSLGWDVHHVPKRSNQQLPRCDAAVIVTTHCGHELQWAVKEEYKDKPIFFAKEGMSSIKEDFEKRFVDPIAQECLGKAKTAAIRWFIATTTVTGEKFSKNQLLEKIKNYKIQNVNSSDVTNALVEMNKKGEMSTNRETFPIKYTFLGVGQVAVKDFENRGFKNLTDLQKNVKKQVILSLDDLLDIKTKATQQKQEIKPVLDIFASAQAQQPPQPTVPPVQQITETKETKEEKEGTREKEEQKEQIKELPFESLTRLENEISQLKQSFSSVKASLESAISLIVDLTSDFSVTKNSLTEKVENLKTHIATDLNFFIARTDLLTEQVKKSGGLAVNTSDLATKADIKEVLSIFEMANDLSKLDEKTREKVKKIIDLML
jgi:hypothetical protein